MCCQRSVRSQLNKQARDWIKDQKNSELVTQSLELA